MNFSRLPHSAATPPHTHTSCHPRLPTKNRRLHWYDMLFLCLHWLHASATGCNICITSLVQHASSIILRLRHRWMIRFSTRWKVLDNNKLVLPAIRATLKTFPGYNMHTHYNTALHFYQPKLCATPRWAAVQNRWKSTVGGILQGNLLHWKLHRIICTFTYVWFWRFVRHKKASPFRNGENTQ